MNPASIPYGIGFGLSCICVILFGILYDARVINMREFILLMMVAGMMSFSFSMCACLFIRTENRIPPPAPPPQIVEFTEVRPLPRDIVVCINDGDRMYLGKPDDASGSYVLVVN